MFTGIISDISDIRTSEKNSLNLVISITRPSSWTDLKLGDSVSVNGACLTVKSLNDISFECELIPETLMKTTFGKSIPNKVNLERAMLLSDRLDGHIVQGHVDFIAEVANVKDDDGHVVTLTIPEGVNKYFIPKGSVTINGVSLTIISAADNNVTVALIPYTLDHTTLNSLKAGDMVNVELDIIGKYIIRQLKNGA